jgi:HAD superfamily hydrolase (TIGR01509 family)
MIKAILFDMDGVLIDARDWHYEALNRALALFGMEIARDAHLATFDGLPTRRKLDILTKTRSFPLKLHEFVNALKQSYTTEIAHARCHPVFQHRFALSELKRDGFRLAVCSNSIRQTVALLMRLSALEQYIELQLSNEDVGRAKPDPEIYVKAISKFGIQPAEALILEDNEHGIQAARASGAHVLLVGSPDDVTYARIRATIDSISAPKGPS